MQLLLSDPQALIRSVLLVVRKGRHLAIGRSDVLL